MMYEPRYTPWGSINSCHRLCEGAYIVTTPGHGGIMVAQARVNDLLSPAAQKIGFYESGYRCYEEDCDAPVAFREFLDRKLISTYPGSNCTPAEFAEIIDDSCQRWHPEYWQARDRQLAAQRDTADPTKTRPPRKERER